MSRDALRFYNIKVAIIGWVIIVASNAAWAQATAIPTHFYSINEGLSERLVTDITQTRDGFMWIATNDGLNRFDGYEFLVFNNAPDNSNRLTDVNIERLLHANDELVIVYRNNYTYFDILNPSTQAITKVNLLPDNRIMGIVRQITIGKNGEILVLTAGVEGIYLHQYVVEQQRFKLLFQIKEQKEHQTSNAQILQLKNGNYLLNDSESGMRLVSKEGKILQLFQESDFNCKQCAGTYPSTTTFMHLDRKGRIWVAFQNKPGVFLYAELENCFAQYDQLPTLPYYWHVWEDKVGNLLFSQTDGHLPYPEVKKLFCLKKDGKLMNLSYLADLGPRILRIYGDDFFKTIFLGIDTGLKIAQNNRSRIKTFLSRPLSEADRGSILRGITGNEQEVYFCEEGGKWYHLNLENDSLRTLNLINRKTGNPIELNCATDMLLDDKGAVWGITCDNSGGQLNRCDPATGLTDIFSYPHQFRAFVKSRDGSFWLLAEPTVGSEKGILVNFDPITKQFNKYGINEINNPIKNAAPLFLLENHDGLLWVGTNNGLIRIDPFKSTSRTYEAMPENKNKGLKSNTIYVIHEDEEGKLWVGTNNGLSVLNPKTDIIKSYDHENGLASNTVCGIVPDEKGNYWISTFNGLSYFDQKNQEFHNFYQVDGLTHDEFNRFSYYRDVNGRFYFGGVNGLNTFYSKDLLIDEKISPVVLTKLVRFNRKIDSLQVQYHHLSNLKKLEISPYDTYFQLHFMLPKFANPLKNQFEVKLEGYEKNWTYLGNTPFVRYNSLPAGTYTLLIQGADPNGNWTKEPLKIKIIVRQIFYRTGWFIFLIILLITLFAFFFSRYHWSQKLQVERFRTKLSSDLHDELSGLLSGIAMQTDMLQLTSKDETTQSRLQHIGEVSRKAMSKMSDVIWSIDARKDKIEDLIHRMREYADDILLPLNIQYALTVKRIDAQHRVPPTIRQELYLIFKESLTNVTKHSDATKVYITLGNIEGIFVMEIQDNGKGVPRHNSSVINSGQGLSNIKMRAQRIKARVEIIKDEGYTIRLRMRRFA